MALEEVAPTGSGLTSGEWRVTSLKKKQVPQASRPGRDKFRPELQHRNDNSQAFGRAGLEDVVEMEIERVGVVRGREGRGSRCCL